MEESEVAARVSIYQYSYPSRCNQGNKHTAERDAVRRAKKPGKHGAGSYWTRNHSTFWPQALISSHVITG